MLTAGLKPTLLELQGDHGDHFAILSPWCNHPIHAYLSMWILACEMSVDYYARTSATMVCIHASMVYFDKFDDYSGDLSYFLIRWRRHHVRES